MWRRRWLFLLLLLLRGRLLPPLLAAAVPTPVSGLRRGPHSPVTITTTTTSAVATVSNVNRNETSPDNHNNTSNETLRCRIRHLAVTEPPPGTPDHPPEVSPDRAAPLRIVCHDVQHNVLYRLQWEEFDEQRHHPRRPPTASPPPRLPLPGDWWTVPTAWIRDVPTSLWKDPTGNGGNSHETAFGGRPTIVVPPHAGRRQLSVPTGDDDDEDVLLSSSGGGRDNNNNHQQDHTELRHGVKTLLAVRVVTATEAPEVRSDELEAALFGTRPHTGIPTTTTTESTTDPAGLRTTTTASSPGTRDKDEPYQSVADQFAAVSAGQLRYTPLRGPGYEYGVLELYLADDPAFGPNYVWAGQGVQSAATALVAATARRLGVPSADHLQDVVDHVVYCLPPNALLAGSPAWTAFTYLYEPTTFYQRSRCTKLSVVMHEMGHSLGFQHSGVPGNVYADETGPMGYSINQYGVPRKGFNSHKNWISGWFRPYSIHLAPLWHNQHNTTTSTTYVGQLAALADVSRIATSPAVGNEVVLIRLGETLFLQYNRAKGFHVETGTPDTVTIVYAAHQEAPSTRVAALEVGDVYEHTTVPDDDASSGPDDNAGLVVVLCDVGVDTAAVDYAELVIQWRSPYTRRDNHLASTLCNMRHDPDALLYQFGVEVDLGHADDSNPRDNSTNRPPSSSDNDNDQKEHILMIVAVIMAGLGGASLVVFTYLVCRNCRRSTKPTEPDANHGPPVRQVVVVVDKPISAGSVSPGDSFDTEPSQDST